jgi:urea transport system permease protein
VSDAIRDAETRVMFSGYNPVYFKLFIWTLSAVICGIAARSTCRRSASSTARDVRRPTRSEIAIWTAVAGAGR